MGIAGPHPASGRLEVLNSVKQFCQDIRMIYVMVGIIRNKISEYSRRVTRFTITRYWPGSVSFLRTVPREIIGESRQTGIVHLGVEPAYPVHCQFKANILACFNVAAVP